VVEAPKVQIFATDIDESAIAQAREGLYTINDLADVSPERLRRFFNKEGDNFRIRREIRESILFAHHNFLKDPPFSHLDLISCRNVLIYLNNVAQERAVETFHFALNPGSFLFLGAAESVDGATDLYASYNREYHIFQSRHVNARTFPVPESVPQLNVKDTEKIPDIAGREKQARERISFGELHQQLLEEYAPPSLVINEEHDIVHLTERAGKYLQIGGGELSQNLLNLLRPELRLEMRSALYQATQRQTAVEARGLKVVLGDKTETLNIHVRPVSQPGNAARGFILVVFEPTAEEAKQDVVLASDEPVAKQLEEELIRLKTQLRNSNEQHEFQAEELKASNEELQAMNEELRSAAEELETSKEELQSINEELRTVNQELKIKIEETSISSNNLQNLINSAEIGTIFLDRSFRVALFTPAVRTIFNLIPADYGRPLSDITHKLGYHDLQHDAEKVLDKLTVAEREITTTDGRTFLMRVLPYRTAEDRISGVVITFVDITKLKGTEKNLRESQQNLEIALEAAEMGTWNIDMLTMTATTNLRHNQIFGYDKPVNKWSREIYLQHALPEDVRLFDEAYAMAVESGVFDVELRVKWPDGSLHWIYDRGRVFYDEQKNPVRMAGVTLDITDRKRNEEELRQNMDELVRFNRAMVSRESRMIELKKEVNDLCSKVGEEPRYALDFEKE
jgi:two-component system CheB/CheR fusion protein